MKQHYMDPVRKEIYLQELEAFALKVEFSVNRGDGNGFRCPGCGCPERDRGQLHNNSAANECPVARMCNRVREVAKAHADLGLDEWDDPDPAPRFVLPSALTR